MSAILTFIIPVRHPENSRDWAQGMKKLQETAASIANQQHAGWRAIVVANTVAELPDLPAGFSVERVDFPPNPQHEKAGQSTEQFYESFRIDKGRRVLAALLKGRDSRFIMIVDDDDFVSCRLSGFVAARPEANGWTIRDGFVWGDGGKLLYRHNDFSNLCGSCHIVRTDLYGIPERFEDATEDYIKRMLGSHRFIEPLLESAGAPLAPLPFAGAIYRIGHAGAHSRSSTVLRTFVFNPRNLRRPHSVARHISRLRLLSPKLRQEFFGDPVGKHET
jgi:hypothetical protein